VPTSPSARPLPAADPAPTRRVPRVGPLLRSTHPEPVVAVTAVTTALAASSGRSVRGCAGVAAAALAGQLSVGWCNDYVDRGRDALAGRTDKPVALGEVAPAAAAVAAGAALLAAVPLSLLSGPRAARAHLAAVGLAWSYDLGVKGTAASVVPYAGAFGLLPAFVARGLPGSPPPAWWAVVAAALLGSGAHFANALPDLVDDLAAGVRGLPHRLGGGRSRVVAAAALTASSLVLTFGPGRPGSLALAGSAAAVALGVVGASAGGRVVPTSSGGAGDAAAARGVAAASGGAASRVPFRATLGVAVVDVALLIVRGRTLA